MTFANDEEFDRWAYMEDHFSDLTPSNLAAELAHFTYKLAEGKDYDWLAMAIRRALALSVRAAGDGPDRQPNAETRKEIQGLAKRSGKLWLALRENLSQEADDALYSYAFRNWAGEREGISSGDPTEWKRFRSALAELDWLSGWLRRAADQIPSQRPRWTEREVRNIRIQRGLALAPIYLSAYRVNTLASKAFGDFYQRVTDLAFDEGDIPDFESMMSEIRQSHSKEPLVYEAHFIPGI